MPTILTLANIHDEIRRRFGETDTSNTSITDTEITRQVNQYTQRLPARASQLGRELGLVADGKTMRFDMWRTSTNSTTSPGPSNLIVTAGSQNIDFPNDYDHWISFYDRTHTKPIYVVEEVSRWLYEELRDAPSGPTKAVEIRGFVSGNGSVWRRRGQLWPSVTSGVTPSIEMLYWRLPADLESDGDTLDIDHKYVMLPIYGAMLEVLRDDDPAYTRYERMEAGMLVDLARSGRAT